MTKMQPGFKKHQRILESSDDGTQIGRKSVVLSDPSFKAEPQNNSKAAKL